MRAQRIAQSQHLVSRMSLRIRTVSCLSCWVEGTRHARKGVLSNQHWLRHRLWSWAYVGWRKAQGWINACLVTRPTTSAAQHRRLQRADITPGPSTRSGGGDSTPQSLLSSSRHTVDAPSPEVVKSRRLRVFAVAWDSRSRATLEQWKARGVGGVNGVDQQNDEENDDERAGLDVAAL